ncbi:MAG: anti-sigma factor family protein, partial [Anaerolineales bacterium]
MSSDPRLDHLTDEDLQSYLDGELEATQVGRATAHLRTCLTCQERAHVSQGVFQALRDLPEARLQRDLAPGVLNRIRPTGEAASRWPWLV